MIILVAGANRRGHQRIGDFITPDRWGRMPTTPVWAADNGAFSGFDESRFLRMIDAFAEVKHRPRFVAMPDVVANWDRTLHLFGRWHRELAVRYLNRAIVLQDGMEAYGSCRDFWQYVEAVFIGGTTAFKMGSYVRWLCQSGILTGKWIHMGRVNGLKRARYARDIGCHSIDGSGLARFPRELSKVVNGLQQDTRQLMLL